MSTELVVHQLCNEADRLDAMSGYCAGKQLRLVISAQNADDTKLKASLFGRAKNWMGLCIRYSDRADALRQRAATL